MLVWWHKFSGLQKEELQDIPLLLKLSKDLAFRMVADDPRVDECTQIQLLRPELRHRGGRGSTIDVMSIKAFKRDANFRLRIEINLSCRG